MQTRYEVQQGERRREFERCIAACRRSAFAVAYHVLADAAEAEDVTQEGCLRAWLHYDAYDPSRPFEPWLLRIVRNLAIDAQRRHTRRRSVSLDTTERGNEEGPWLGTASSDQQSDPQARVLAVAEEERLLAAVTGLPSPHRQVLWLLYGRQESYEAIARELDCPIGTVRSRVFRARKAARAALALADAAI